MKSQKAIARIFGIFFLLAFISYPIGVQLGLPGGLFEISLSIWLIIKGFKESERITN